jgi:sugar phosphate isomerase/epimerase
VLAMENHYKDGSWRWPEFAQKMDLFLAIVDAIEDRTHFGVQYDPSNAIVAGDDPIALLERVCDRVVTLHASDRYLEAGATLEELRQTDGTIGYFAKLKHGVTGRGLNDYDRIFAILAAAHYQGWVSIEDGMNGMDEMKASIDFLKCMREKYFTAG